MGLVKAALGAASGVMGDQWKEYFTCSALPADVLAVKGEKKQSGRSANRHGSENIITDGSAAEASQVMSDQNKLTTIRVNPRALPKVGATVKIKIDPAKMHLFAPSTELRLN